MKKVIISIVILLIVIFVLNYSLKLNSKKPTNKPQIARSKDISLRLKWTDLAQFTGFYVAKNAGLYSQAGLNVKLNPGGPDISPMQMVVTGVDQFGITGADQIILARAKGIPVVGIAVIYKESPVAIASLKKYNITKPKDLEGKKVAVVYGRDEETIYKALLTKEGVDRNKINEVSKVFDSSQIATEKIDASLVYLIDEPVILRQKGLELNIIRPLNYGIQFYADTLFTTEDLIKKNPDIVNKIVKASIAGWKKAIENPKDGIDQVLAVNNALNREHQEKQLELSIPMINQGGNIGRSDKKTLENIQKMLLDQNLLKSPVDLDKAFTNSYLD